MPSNIYLANHALGCLTQPALAANAKYLQLWQDQGNDAWGQWLDEINNFCKVLATFLNAKPDEFCPQPNISAAIYKIFTALPQRPGRNKILISDLDFPSIGFLFSQAKPKNYQLEFIKNQQGRYPLELWEQHLTSDTQVVMITHVLSENSYRNDIAAISKLAREKGIFVIVDIAQSAGTIPIDFQTWSADFIVGTCIKWLCGGPGAAFLWSNSQGNTQFYPSEVGWFSHQNPFEFDINHFEYAADAKRYWGGTPSVLPFIMAKASIELLTSIGIQKITEHNQKLIDQLVNNLLPQGFVINSPLDSARGGTVIVELKNSMLAPHFLKEKNIVIDHRKKFGLRISPHIYNTAEEIEQFVECLTLFKENNQ